MYYALIGDVVNSRNIKDRYTFQDTLKDKLEEFNGQARAHVVSKLTLTLGDEFQGLFSSIQPILQIIDEMDTFFSSYDGESIEMRYGIGYGTVITEIDKNLSIGSDGPVYWRARRAIDTIYDNNDGHNTNSYIILDDGKNDVINSMIRIIDAIRNNWTRSQSEFMHAVFNTSGYATLKPKNIANAMGLSPQQVSNRIKSTYARQYIDARNGLIVLIEKETEHD